MEKDHYRRLNVKISVIIPIYNMDKYLEECIESVMIQSLEDIEVILVDDGSTDSSPQICDFYKKDKRVIVIHQANGGLSNARNTGMGIANGEYLMFLDADDYLAHKDCLKDIYVLANNKNLDILHYSADVHYDYNNEEFTIDRYRIKISNDSTMTGLEMFSELWDNQCYSSSACMHLINNDFIKINNINFYDGILHEDNVFTMKCLVRAKKVRFIDNPIYIRRIREGSIMTAKKSFSNIYGFFVCYMEFLNILKTPDVEAIMKKNKHIMNNFENIMSVIRNNALECFKDLTNIELEQGINKLREYEKVIFKNLFIEKLDTKTDIDNLQSKIDMLENENITTGQQLREITNSKRWKLLNKILLIKDRI